MRIEGAKTVEDLKDIERTILELMSSPWCDGNMFTILSQRLRDVRMLIKEKILDNHKSIISFL